MKDFCAILGVEAFMMGGNEAISDEQSETGIAKAQEEILNSLIIIMDRFKVNVHHIFANFDNRKDYTLESTGVL